MLLKELLKLNESTLTEARLKYSASFKSPEKVVIDFDELKRLVAADKSKKDTNVSLLKHYLYLLDTLEKNPKAFTVGDLGFFSNVKATSKNHAEFLKKGNAYLDSISGPYKDGIRISKPGIKFSTVKAKIDDLAKEYGINGGYSWGSLTPSISSIKSTIETLARPFLHKLGKDKSPQVFAIVYDSTAGEHFPETFLKKFPFSMEAGEDSIFNKLTSSAKEAIKKFFDEDDLDSSGYPLSAIQIFSNKDIKPVDAAKEISARFEKSPKKWWDVHFT